MDRLKILLLIVGVFSSLTCSKNEREVESSSQTLEAQEDSAIDKGIAVPTIKMKGTSTVIGKSNQSINSIDVGIPNINAKQHLPEDFIIGELGQGEIPLEVYNIAKDFCKQLLNATYDVTLFSFLPLSDQNKVTTLLRSSKVSQFRIGGGQIEENDRYSLLIRLLGPSESVSGVIYIRYVNTAWVIDDISFEKDKKSEFNLLQYKHFL
ncbi:hypothetical protein [Gracilinema caldarium]|uniref:Uncharacterized protein n=1 Tax=Gracilinema caldarium (strain ATCC 51460 / DSM 7334 / H1) TaxID=744872 RepID=F8EZ06_GRAC1|nr:hypothetical protein [Gracilinema caldarium]AEJ19237.1 hypothetical protein Spica_1090 [Gracilinema caldarium DSM 7334]